MPSRLVIALLAALAITTCAALWGWSSAGQYKGIAEQRTREVAALQGQLTRTKAAVQAASKKAQAAESALQEALDAEPAWRDAAVPDAVADGLCKHLRCK